MRKVTVLLTGYSDWLSSFICMLSKGYSHASIAIDDKEEVFYSFNKNGFVIEKPKKYNPKARRENSVCIRMEVPQEVYEKIEEEIQLFIANKEKYKYSQLGLICCLLKIPVKFKNQYICTQFVTELLEKAGAVQLNKKESLYLPANLLDQMKCCYGNMKLVYNAI